MAGLLPGDADLGPAAAGTLVLVTGSVITAGDARLLLTGAGPAGPARGGSGR
jgi:hypothetical protein